MLLLACVLDESVSLAILLQTDSEHGLSHAMLCVYRIRLQHVLVHVSWSKPDSTAWRGDGSSTKTKIPTNHGEKKRRGKYPKENTSTVVYSKAGSSHTIRVL